MLNIAAVDAHAAASQLRTVEHNIKGLGADKLGAGFDVLKILRIGHGKGVVHGDIALLCLGVFKHGKIGYKQKAVIVFFGKTLNMSMVEYFFSVNHSECSKYFETITCKWRATNDWYYYAKGI